MMFQVIWACTPHNLATAQIMETNIALQEADKQARLDWVEVLRVKIAEAAKLKAAIKEKRVSWSTLECEDGSMDAGQSSVNFAINTANNQSQPKQPKQGSKYRRSQKLDSPDHGLSAISSTPQSQNTTTPYKTSATTNDEHLQDKGAPSSTSPHDTLPHKGARIKRALFSDLANLCQDALIWASLVDSMSRLTKVTPAGTPAPDRLLALNSSNYLVPPHHQMPVVKQDNTAHRKSRFLMLHRIAPGSKGHFWFLQVGIKYLDNQDARTTMLLGLLLLMDILPDAIDGFAMHPLEESSLFPPLTYNRVEDGFPAQRC
jgi:hypothetical protein